MRKFIMTHCYKRPSSVHMLHTLSKQKWVTSQDENREMMALWPDVVKDLTEADRHSVIPDVAEWSKKILQYNVSNGSMKFSFDLVNTYKKIAHPDQLTDENIRLARILGWCSEIMQAFILIEDDIMDRSKTRRGKPCWYLHNNIGLTAINDGVLLEQMSFKLLRIHFSQKPYYRDLLDTIHENLYKVIIGQASDILLMNHDKKPNLNLFTMDRYKAMIKYKTTYSYSEMPLILAMYLAEVKDNEMFRRAKSVLLQMGNFIQIQDDYLDCFEDPQITGKISSDIEEGKCSWPIVAALERVSPAQRKVLEECYGENDPEKVARVKQLYHDLGLQTIFSDYKQEIYNSIKTYIQQTSQALPRDLLFEKLNSIFRKNGHTNPQMEQTEPQTVATKDESRELMALWPDVVKDLTESGRDSDFPDVTKWMKKILQYNVPGGKMSRASDLVNAYKKIAHPNQLTDENIRLARILGWCTEMTQAFFLMADDIMDHSTTRRGKPCWYLHNNIGLSAVNDAILVEQRVYQLLQIHFREKSCFIHLVDTFHENIYKTTMGEALDLMSTTFEKKPNLNLFTMERHNTLVKYKAAYYSFVMPVTLAMHLAEIKDKEMFRQAETILLEIGNFFQIQDDYLDCFGNPQVTGKIGTDIQEGKCTWLIVIALQRATSAQKKILEDCYGVNDPEKVARVKQLYHDLELQTVYSVFEEENYSLIKTHIKNISCGLPHDLFFKILNKLYHRNK